MPRDRYRRGALTVIRCLYSEDDIYKLGSLAAIKAIHDPNNPFLPYNLNMFPQKKAELTSFVDPVACLARVTTRDIGYPELD